MVRSQGGNDSGAAEGLARQLERLRAALRAPQLRQEDPAAQLRRFSDGVDELLDGLLQQLPAEQRRGVSLIALGGHGRRELFPFADLDLLILHARQLSDDEALERVVRRLVYPLWDAGLTVGHAVRDVEQMLAQAGRELAVRTSLLDARWIGGDERPFEQLRRGAEERFFAAARVNRFVEELVEERRARHERFGATIYLLEPNIKRGKGGLRDVNTARWAARARFAATTIDRLAEVGAASERQQRQLADAQRFLRRLRLAMQLATGRCQDQLTFALQQQLAPRLFPDRGPRPGRQRTTARETAAIEQLMLATYRATRVAALETEGVLQRCSVARPEPAAEVALGEHFAAVGDALRCRAPQLLWERPVEMLGALALAEERDLQLQRALQDEIAEAAAGAPGAQLAADEEAARLWRRLLVRRERVGRRGMLEQMHDLGLLTAMIPELEPCTGRAQHDLYHVYTVDQHSLYVVGLLKAIRRGEHAADLPTATTVIGELPQLETLLLAALLHDVGKPLGERHAERGARLAAGVVARLGLSVARQQEVVFLVRHHLAVPNVAQRRDLADPAVIRSFAELAGSTRRLRQLYLLGLADTAMTAPGNLDDWKTALYTTLFIRAHRQLTRGHQTESVVQLRRRELRLALQESWGEEPASVAERLPAELLAAHDVDRLIHHVGVALELEDAAEREVVLGWRREQGMTILTVCCDDRPGLLATITGVLLVCGVDVHAAQVYTVGGAAASAPDRALDLFWVAPPPAADLTLWDDLAARLRQALAGELQLAELVARRTEPSPLPPRVVPEVETRVRIDNDASARCSVVELQAADRFGLLHAVTRALSDLELEIDLSKVATEAGRVVDVFYVRRRGGGKVTDEAQLEQIRCALAEAVRALERK